MKPSHLKIAIMILNYNGEKYLDEVLGSLRFLTQYPEHDVWIIDNASGDDSSHVVAACHPWVNHYRNKENLGFGEGYNAAIKYIDEQHSYSHYIFLNSDVSACEKWFQAILGELGRNKKNIGEWGVRSLFRNPFFEETLLSANHSIEQLQFSCSYKGRFQQMELGERKMHFRTMYNGRKPTPETEYEAFLNGQSVPAGTFDNIQFLLRNAGTKTLNLVFSENLRAFKTSTSSVEPCLLPKIGLFLHPTRRVNADTVFLLNEGKLSEEWHNCPNVVQITSCSLGILSSATLCRVICPDTKLKYLIQNSGSGINSSFEGYDLHLLEPSNTLQTSSRLKAICGVCKIIPKDVFHRIGGFRPEYFMYYEDTDLSLSIQNLGFEIKVIDNAYLLHEHGGSSLEYSPFFNRQVSWSLLIFHFHNASFLRRIKTLLSYTIHSWMDSSEKDESIYSKPKLLALKKLRDAGISRFSYIFKNKGGQEK